MPQIASHDNHGDLFVLRMLDGLDEWIMLLINLEVKL